MLHSYISPTALAVLASHRKPLKTVGLCRFHSTTRLKPGVNGKITIRPSFFLAHRNLHMSYKDKVVIITGGSHGIGEGCVRAFVAAGAKVVFCARNDRDGERLAAEVNASGPGEAQFIRCDVSKVEEIQSLIDETVERFGRIDCLINNAGWHPPNKPIDEFSIDDFRGLLDLNLLTAATTTNRIRCSLPVTNELGSSLYNVARRESKSSREPYRPWRSPLRRFKV